MSLETILQNLMDSSLAISITEGEYYFPWLEALHVLCICTVVGTITIVDLRLIGVPSHKPSVSRLIRELLPFTWIAFIFAVIFGSLLFISNAVTYAHNLQFQLKMALLVLAGINMAIFHLVTQRKMHLWDEDVATPAAAKIAGFVSLALWISVIFLGRWVGFTI